MTSVEREEILSRYDKIIALTKNKDSAYKAGFYNGMLISVLVEDTHEGKIQYLDDIIRMLTNES